MTLTAQPLPNDYVNATWPDVLPRFDALATMPLSLDNVERWLADWSALESAVSEAIQLASVAYTVDTTDPEKEAAYQRMAGEIEPHMEEQRVRLSRRLLELGYTRPIWRRPSGSFGIRMRSSAKKTCRFSKSCRRSTPNTRRSPAR